MAGKIEQYQGSQHQMPTSDEDDGVAEHDNVGQDAVQPPQDHPPHATDGAQGLLEQQDAAQPASSRYHQRQQVRLELQLAVEQQLAQFRSSAALHARAQLHLGPGLAGGPCEAPAQHERQPLLALLTSKLCTGPSACMFLYLLVRT